MIGENFDEVFILINNTEQRLLFFLCILLKIDIPTSCASSKLGTPQIETMLAHYFQAQDKFFSFNPHAVGFIPFSIEWYDLTNIAQ